MIGLTLLEAVPRGICARPLGNRKARVCCEERRDDRGKLAAHIVAARSTRKLCAARLNGNRVPTLSACPARRTLVCGIVRGERVWVRLHPRRVGGTSVAGLYRD